MSADSNFVYDSEGNLIEDRSKSLKISYDWRGMPVEFVHDVSDAKDAYKLLMAYDGSGRRISKTRMLNSIKNMSTEPKPDQIYLNDYNAAKEMGIYDE